MHLHPPIRELEESGDLLNRRLQHLESFDVAPLSRNNPRLRALNLGRISPKDLDSARIYHFFFFVRFVSFECWNTMSRRDGDKIQSFYVEANLHIN